MKRRKLLLGSGSAFAATAFIGTGAFSRVESQRSVTVEVEEDEDAYLGLAPSDSEHGDNFAEIDDNGHLEIDIGEIDDEDDNTGSGVNSNSITWFDCVFTITNQGKDEANVYVEEEDNFVEEEGDEGTIDFYTDEASGSQGDDGIDSIVGSDNEITLPVGDSECIGIRVNSEEENSDDIDGDVTIVADSEDAGDEENNNT
ncbi:uncharacterized protein Nmag_3372 [Natrialba magadii ATCC 43099]|uniref:DUF1102 domain-containing protein n=1 Tax=Natrialba magadii (strain ATCC 43099 / DSM 3394 / CCM 3739 / CIP 104546 / IAM 13178 / JCM 8861 / NBRC 102185 / NCIMB 2190 / MS3) TaxID=547559 RepID=D3ST55_NATMM|nr:DUF1102 domain-containing protein [Natrialba magadii]ADD06922.1 uncharacterized protein Nmag_3372 [Natrialba magadii ATCC 43099]ELY28454.1 hypothetical protein C500_13367 [Natrialba magadii ATCC 43099]